MPCVVLNNNRGKVGWSTHLFFILWFLGMATIGYSQSAIGNVRLAYDDVLRLKLEPARERLSSMSPAPSELPLYVYTENLADVLELILTEDRELYAAMKDGERQRLKQLQAIPDNSPYKEFCIAEVRLQWAFVKLKFGDTMSATWGLTQAYRAILRNEQRFFDFMPNKKTLGLINSVLGAVPQQYHWLLGILGLKGSSVEGKAQLASVASSGGLFSLEAQLMLHLIDIYLLEGRKETQQKFGVLANKTRDNKLIQYLYAMILIKTNEAETALSMLETMDNLSDEYLFIPMMDYLKGEVYLQKGKYGHSDTHFNAFLSSYKGDNFVKDSYYKLFLSKWLSGDDQQAKLYFELAKKKGTTSAEADRYAARQVAINVWPERTIMKIRLATDGGYYTQAEALVNARTEVDYQTLQDQVEFVYRKARLYDKQEKENEAVKLYLETIARSGENPWYYAPNAALQLGYYYRQKGNLEASKTYFEKALSYEGHEYKNSIDHKAKIALQEMQ